MTGHTTADYCRQIEAYLCRRNDGHLIRIVGPAFERVSSWAGQGIPLKVAFQGIDRYIDRQPPAPVGRRRRPVRIEFCEADILDAFDAWRRAVGVVAGRIDDSAGAPGRSSGDTLGRSSGDTPGQGGWGDAGSTDERGPGASAPGVPRGSASGDGPPSAKRVALQAHIDRVLARLTQRRLEPDVPAPLAEAIDRLLPELDALRPRAHGARGDQRTAVVRELEALDARLMSAAGAATPPDALARLDAEARRDLQPFKERMTPAVFAQSVDSAVRRLLREAVGIPEIAPGV